METFSGPVIWYVGRVPWFARCVRQAILVLSVIQDKLNNPSPDDPFEPEIANVR